MRASSIRDVWPVVQLLGWVCFAPVSACTLEVLDFRDEPAFLLCDENQRENPQTGLCEPCLRRRENPEDLCLCGADFVQGPFPLCAGDDADFRCRPCVGNVASCKSFLPQTQTISDCDAFFACCAELDNAASQGLATPCCPQNSEMRCGETGALGNYAWECESCCVGASCTDNEQCGSGQNCVDERCFPSCAADQACAANCSCVPIGDTP